MQNHIDNILAKAFKLSVLLCNNTGSSKTSNQLNCYNMDSLEKYCAVVWSPIYQVHVKRIERTQMKIVNLMLYKLTIDPANIPHEKRLQIIRLDALLSRRNRIILRFGQKILICII